MAKFVTGNELNLEVERILEAAESKILLISPFIKLHERYSSVLKTKIENHKLEIIIVFGKNEGDISRSMKKEDFDFFKSFPNIQIRYEKRLHAKYYANESAAILTSMNLYNYSQDNNIEAGVLTKVSLFGAIAGNLITNVTGEPGLDDKAWEYFGRVIDQSELLFQKKPQYESAILGLSRKYIDSVIEIDKLTDFFSNKSGFDFSGRSSLTFDKKKNILTDNKDEARSGFCIRTGKPIAFNPRQPFCDEAFQSWAKFSNGDYPEKYCHFSGEDSKGETTKSKPILRRNWSEAKKTYGI